MELALYLPFGCVIIKEEEFFFIYECVYIYIFF